MGKSAKPIKAQVIKECFVSKSTPEVTQYEEKSSTGVSLKRDEKYSDFSWHLFGSKSYLLHHIGIFV